MIRSLFLQVELSQHLSSANFTSVLTSNDSFFNQVIKDGDLNKAVQIANTILEAISQDSSLSTEEKTKVVFQKNTVYNDPHKTEKSRTDVQKLSISNLCPHWLKFMWHLGASLD